MWDRLVRKSLVVGIIVLFIGVGVQPAFANDNIITGNVKQQLGNKYSIKTNPVILLGETFMKTLGGTDYDDGCCVQQTIDGGYIITGGARLIKTDSAGNILWNRTFGGTYGYCVQQTTDGGYIIVGETGSDVWLIKTNSSGNKQWEKTFGGADKDVGYCVQQTTDGGYIITGIVGHTYYGGAIWLIKTDNTGNKQWEKTFEGTLTEYNFGYCVQQTTDEGYIIAGYRYGYWYGKHDVWLIKTDIDGNIQWDKTFGETWYNTGYYVQQTTDGGYIITGETNKFPAESVVWLIKTDSSGNMLWNRTFGVTGFDSGYCVQQTTDGGYILIGETGKFYVYNNDVWLIKTDKDGNKQWDKTFGGENIDSGRCVRQTTDGGYIIVGKTDDNLWLIKTDKDGNKEWDNTFKRTLANYNFDNCVQQTTDESQKNKAVSSNMLLQKLLEKLPLMGWDF